MAIDQSLARAVARRNLANWIAVGASFEHALKKWLGQAHLEIEKGRPPAKVVKKALDQLARLTNQSGLPGEARDCGGRRHEITICMPEAVEDKVSFVLVSGSANGRNGAIRFTRRRVLTASQHVLERLHQRLATQDSLVVLREILSCLTSAAAMDEAAQIAGARHWPLVTTNGLFVCAPSEGDGATTLVTWMRLDQLGKKWGRVADDLRAASSQGGLLLEDKDFCVELLRLHSWLLSPHTPGPDLAAMWWASRPQQEQEEAVREFEESLAEQGAESVIPLLDGSELACASSEAEERDALSASDAAGQPHVVKARDKYTGIVVQVRSMGARIVALRNGFFGVLSQGNLAAEGSENLTERVAAIELGARVPVDVLRVVGEYYTGPHSIVLQLTDVADAKWLETQQRYSVGSMVSGMIVWRGVGGAVIAMPDGASGWLPDTGIAWSQADPEFRESLVVGKQMQLQVVGYAPKYRRLVLSAPRAPGHPADTSVIEARYPVGATVEGSIVWRGTSGSVIGMPDGSSGWLPESELGWSRGGQSVHDSLSVGQTIQLRVTGYDPKRGKLVLSLRQVEGHPLDRVEGVALVGTVHRGVVTRVVDYGVFVCLPMGFDALLHRSAMPGGVVFSKGDILDVRVESADKERRRVGLAYVGGPDQSQ